MVTYKDVVKAGLALPDVVESTSYGTPALKLKKELMVRLREDGETLVVKMPFDRRAEMIEGDPDTYFITDHYAGAEWVLVRLDRLAPEALPDLLRTAHREAAVRKKPNLLS